MLYEVNGTCGPYTSLLTKSQSPMSSDGIMLPDGIRYASTKNVRRNRKMAIVPAIDLIHSQNLPALIREPPPPRRAAATAFTGFLDLSAFFLAATSGCARWKEAAHPCSLDVAPALATLARADYLARM